MKELYEVYGRKHCEKKGFTYTGYIIDNVKSDELIGTMKLYVVVAEHFNVKPRSVERAIRYYKELVCSKNVTNGEFLKALLYKKMGNS